MTARKEVRALCFRPRTMPHGTLVPLHTMRRMKRQLPPRSPPPPAILRKQAPGGHSPKSVTDVYSDRDEDCQAAAFLPVCRGHDDSDGSEPPVLRRRNEPDQPCPPVRRTRSPPVLTQDKKTADEDEEELVGLSFVEEESWDPFDATDGYFSKRSSRIAEF